jgi:hypothetical protein
LVDIVAIEFTGVKQTHRPVGYRETAFTREKIVKISEYWSPLNKVILICCNKVTKQDQNTRKKSIIKLECAL